jgi:hypothetical protein
MAITSTQIISVIPPKTSGGSLKNAANIISSAAAEKSEDKVLWAAVTKSLRDAQSQMDGFANALRSPISLPDPIQVLDPTGKLVLEIGQILDPTNQNFVGLWGNAVWIGGTGPTSAILSAPGDGTLTFSQIVFSPASPRAVGYQNSAGTSLANNTLTALSMDTNGAGSSTAVHSTVTNPTRFIAPVAGWYFAAGQLQAPGATGFLEIQVRKNGGVSYGFTIAGIVINSNTNNPTAVCSGPIQMAANDYIEFAGLQTSGGSITSVTTTTWGSLTLLSQP